MNNHVILQTENLSKRFGRFKAVQDLNLEVQQGDIYGFLGLNGAGKTTTIRMILRLIKPNRGKIWLYGKELNRSYLETMKNIGALVEIPAFYSYLSGWDNLALLSRMSYGQADKKNLEKLLTEVGLIKRARDKVKTYSQGMRQRLGIAQALLPVYRLPLTDEAERSPAFSGKGRDDRLPDSSLVILDEPTNGLDPQG
ncbi:MAG: ATP-binding cassette domain-containing protein, partial [Planctomycetota bacterium]